MLPDMSEVLKEWARPYTLKTVTRQTVDFEPTDVVAGRTIDAVVQPAQMEKLNPDQIDWSKKYLQIHSTAPIAMGEFLEYNGEDYKIVDNGDYQRYGFTEAVGEQTKKTILAVTP